MEKSFGNNGELKARIGERIAEPTVRGLYYDYEAIGGMDELVGISNRVPEERRGPLLLALETHVTKEKPMYAAEFAFNAGLDKQSAASIAATVDMLWALSLMYDDMYDGDEERAGRKTSWVQFGKDETLISAQAGLDATISYIDEHFGSALSIYALEAVYRGVSSLDELKAMQLDSSFEQFTTNYDKRAEFHVELPVRLVTALQPNVPVETQREAIMGLYEINRAGQILNDLRDLHTSSRWLRENYSDMRSGTPTIALKQMLSACNEDETKTFMTLFNKQSFDDFDQMQMELLIERTGVFGSTYGLVIATYESAYEHYHRAIQGGVHTKTFDTWIEYKIGHLEDLVRDSTA
ncbi:MAG: polyprenyl synthetase family protein [Candidatus Saccharimonadales bacterium]